MHLECDCCFPRHFAHLLAEFGGNTQAAEEDMRMMHEYKERQDREDKARTDKMRRAACLHDTCCSIETKHCDLF